MLELVAALVAAAALALGGVRWGRRAAFGAGWFERSGETGAGRGDRRPTHGGLVLAVATLLGPGVLLALGPGLGPLARAAAVAGAVAAASALVVEKRRRTWWVPVLQRVAVGLAVAVAAPAPRLTGAGASDRLVLVLLVVTVAGGLSRIERSDGSAAGVLAAAGAAAAVVAGDAGAIGLGAVAGALTGAALAVVAHAAPPGVVRLGATGPAAGAALLVVAAAGAGDVADRGGAVVAVLLLVVPLVAVLVPAFDLRLQAAGMPAVAALAGATAVAGAAAWAVSSAVVPAAIGAVGALPVVLLAARAAAVGRLVDEPPPMPGRRVLVVGLAAAVVVAGGATAYVALSVRDDFLAGREQIDAGLAAARRGDVEAAGERFDRAARLLRAADRTLASPAGLVARAMPVAGANLRVAGTVADLGVDLTDVGVAVARRAGGDELRVVDGRVPIELLATLAEDLGAAVTTLADGAARLSPASPLWLPAVGDEAMDLADRLRGTARDLEPVAEAARLAPQLLGADGPRRWFVGIVTPSELRAGGGLLGDYAVLQADAGRVELVTSEGISTLNRAVDDASLAEVLPPAYASAYGSFEPARFLQNLTASPDGPTIGEALVASYPLSGDAPVDGVILLDPTAVAGLLEATGRIRVDSWPEAINARNAEEVLLERQYLELTGSVRDGFQTEVVDAVVEALITSARPSPAVLADALGPAVAGGHLRLFSPEADEQALFTLIGADGALPPDDGGDVVLVANQNGTEAKIDVFLEREVTYELDHDPGTGAVTGAITVELRNTAPAGGLDPYVIGGDQPRIGGPGVNRTFLSTYTALPVTEVRDAGGTSLPVVRATEGALHVTTYLLSLDPGASATITFEVDGQLAPGPYRLALEHQTLVQPEQVTVAVTSQGRRSVLADRLVLETDVAMGVPR